jgi:hypothetical protein
MKGLIDSRNLATGTSTTLRSENLIPYLALNKSSAPLRACVQMRTIRSWQSESVVVIIVAWSRVVRYAYWLISISISLQHGFYSALTKLVLESPWWVHERVKRDVDFCEIRHLPKGYNNYTHITCITFVSSIILNLESWPFIIISQPCIVPPINQLLSSIWNKAPGTRTSTALGLVTRAAYGRLTTGSNADFSNQGQRWRQALTVVHWQARGSTCWQYQFRCLCAVLAPLCVHLTFPGWAPSPPSPVGLHVVRSLSWRIIVTTTHRGVLLPTHTQGYRPFQRFWRLLEVTAVLPPQSKHRLSQLLHPLSLAIWSIVQHHRQLYVVYTPFSPRHFATAAPMEREELVTMATLPCWTKVCFFSYKTSFRINWGKKISCK